MVFPNTQRELVVTRILALDAMRALSDVDRDIQMGDLPTSNPSQTVKDTIVIFEILSTSLMETAARFGTER